MRGKVVDIVYQLQQEGITPAYAGKSVGGLQSSGSWNRITPAYAGKSRWHCQIKILCQDHPRLCGEKSIEGQRRVCEEGSPPPMRGKAVRCGEFASYSGITPAYAGKRRI